MRQGVRLIVIFALTGMWLSGFAQTRPGSAGKPAAKAGKATKKPARHPRMRFEATADSVSGITAKGTTTHEGIVAADPDVLPLGSLIRVTGAGKYSGIYVVTDTGPKVQGRHIDIYMPSTEEAKQFGRQKVYVRVLVRGDNSKNHKEITPAEPIIPAETTEAAPMPEGGPAAAGDTQ
jgi:3D (Asp-Asp-Asp) domain-containing protein